MSFCCNSGNVSGEVAIGGIVGNNRQYIFHVYNIAIQIKATGKNDDGASPVGGISGTQGVYDDAYIRVAYSKSKVIGKGSHVGGIIGNFLIGTMNKIYIMGEIDTPSTTNVGKIAGYKYDTSAMGTRQALTEEEMIAWNQETITTNLNQFVKKANSLPILNITVREITF